MVSSSASSSSNTGIRRSRVLERRGTLLYLQGHIDVDLAGRVWADALSTTWDGIDR
jgi:hypothetical protein